MPLREDLLNPIAGSNPSGDNLRYAPVYDQIKEARREEDNIAQGLWKTDLKRADWVLVTKLCSDALAKKTKDLQIAAWLTEAALRREGFAGLKDGLDLLRGMIENFWDTLYPEIEDGDLEMRATPLEWVGSRLDQPIKNVGITRSGLDWFKYKESRSVPYETDASRAEIRAQALADGKLAPEEFDAAADDSPLEFYQERMDQLTGCLESLGALSGLSEEKFGDAAPNFGGLRKSLQEVQQIGRVLLAKKREAETGAAGGPAVEEEAAAAPVYEAGGQAAAAAPARARVRRPAGPEPADQEDAAERIFAAARWWRQNDPYSPAPYLIVRGLRWGELRAGGGAEPDAALLEAPPSEVRQELKRLSGDGSWQEVLEAAENAMGLPCGRGWLDLQRYSVRACRELGYEAIATAVRSQLHALLVDMPGLSAMSLTDDTPAANAETRAWIQEEVMSQAAASPESYYERREAPEPPPEELGNATVDAFDLAVQAARSSDVAGAIEILTREIAQEASGRMRFQRKVQLAQICLGAGQESIAGPILESLAEEIERRRLEEWEPPETLAHPLSLLYRSMGKLGASAEERQKVYSRICRLDPVQALEISR